MDTSAISVLLRRGLIGLATFLIVLWLPLGAQAATFVVDSTADAPDANLSDGICLDAAGQCTLRAAIMQSNATPGPNTIDLTQINNPADPIILSIPGADESAVANSTTGGYDVVADHDASKGDLNITNSVDIVGAGPDLTFIEWSPSVKSDPAMGDRVFHVEAVDTSVTVTISGVTIENGVIPPPEILKTLTDGTYYQLKRNGAGIAIGPAAAVSLVDPNAPSGSTDEGGSEGGNSGGEGETSSAVVNSVTLTNVHILDNQSGGDGGGIYSAAPLVLSNVVISGNTAGTATAGANGGGIYNDAALTMSDSTIGTTPTFTTPNSAEGGGGLFDTGLHTTYISSSAIVGNTATGGAGISARSGVVLEVENSTIDGNKATDVGGGIYSNGTVNLQNDTIADNSSENTAGGGAGLNSFGGGSFNFTNTLFQNNTSAAGGVVSCGSSGSSTKTGAMNTGGHNLADDDSCTLNGTGDLPFTNAQLQPLAGNGGPTETRALLSNTPAVDAGDDTTCPNTDQRGSVRPADGNLKNVAVCDIGAFELFIDRADVHVSGKHSPDRVPRGSALNVSADFTNSPDASTDATGVTVTTSALPGNYLFSSATVTTSGSSGATSNCAFDSNTRIVSCDVGTLAVGQTATLSLNGTASAPGRMSFTASIAAASPVDLFPDNNTTPFDILVQGSSNVGISATGPSSQPTVSGGTQINFNVKNQGPDPATEVRVMASFRNRLRYRAMNMTMSNGSNAGTCQLQDDNVSAICNIGTVNPGSTVSGTLDLTGTSTGTTEVALEVTTVDVDSDVADNSTLVPLEIVAAETTTPGTSTATSSGGGGGCVMRPGSPFDPTLLALIAAGLLGTAWRRRRRPAGRP